MKIKKVLTIFTLCLTSILLVGCKEKSPFTKSLADIADLDKASYISRNGEMIELFADDTYKFTRNNVPLTSSEIEYAKSNSSIKSVIPAYGVVIPLNTKSKNFPRKDITKLEVEYNGFDFVPLERPTTYKPIMEKNKIERDKEFQYWWAYHPNYHKNWWIPLSEGHYNDTEDKYTKDYLYGPAFDKHGNFSINIHTVTHYDNNVAGFTKYQLEEKFSNWKLKLYVNDNLQGEELLKKDNNYLPIKQKVSFNNIKINKQSRYIKLVLENEELLNEIHINKYVLNINRLISNYEDYQKVSKLFLDENLTFSLKPNKNLLSEDGFDPYQYKIGDKTQKAYPICGAFERYEYFPHQHLDIRRYSKLSLNSINLIG